MNAAFIMARENSKRLPDKNALLVGGQPLLTYPIRAALAAPTLDAVYLYTDGYRLAEIGRRCGAIILREPPARDDACQADVVRACVRQLRATHGDALQNLVCLLGNTVMVAPADIDACLQLLDRHPELTGSMTVMQAEDDHPMRAFRRDAEGCLLPYLEGAAERSSRVQAYSPAFFQDQGVWAWRAWVTDRNEGPPPWTWMGDRVYGLPRPWIGGRDVDEPLDLEVAEWWLKRKEGACS